MKSLNRETHRRVGQWAAVFVLAVSGTWAGAIVVNDSAELNAALDADATEITLGKAGTYTIMAPRMITNRDLTINSVEEAGLTAFDYKLKGSDGSVGAVFDFISDTESHNATFQGVAFAGGAPFVQVGANTALKFTRCYFNGGSRGVVLNAPTKNVTFAQCIFDGSSPAVQMVGSNSSEVLFYQCTIFGGPLVEGTGTGSVAMTLCLFDGIGPAFSLDPGMEFRWAYSLYGQAANAPVTVSASDLEYVRPAGDLAAPVVFDTNAPWNGKLVDELRSGVSQTNANIAGDFGVVGPAAIVDFERQPRLVGFTDLGIGADEFSFALVLQAVTDVTVTGGNVDYNGDVIIGPNTLEPVKIRIDTTGINLTGARVFVIPETAVTAAPVDLTLFTEANIDVLNNEAGYVEATFRPTATCVNDVLQDGMAQVVLLAETRLWPNLAIANDIQVYATFDDRKIIIDTTPPTLSGGDIGNTGRMLLTNHNDPNFPPAMGAGFKYPEGWSPWEISPISASAGSLATGSDSNAQVFLNPAGVLDFEATVTFEDPPPAACVSGGPTISNGGGFANPATLTLPAISVGLDLNQSLKDTLGIVRMPEDSVDPRLAPFPATVTINNIHLAGDRRARTSFAFFDILTIGQSESMALRFEATDAAGNRASVSNPFRVWWLLPDDFTVATALDSSEDAFSMSWKVTRSQQPAYAFPAFPIARFRLFRSINPTFNTSGWEAVTDWSEWTLDKVLTRQSIFTGSVRLGDLLDSPQNTGAMLMAFQIADEAGNLIPIISNTGVDLDQADPVVPTTEDLGGIVFETWDNDPSSAGYETTIETNIFYNNIKLGDLREFEERFGEVSFGNAGRVPILPESECDFRIEAQFKLYADFPLTTAIPDTAGIGWDLYEDSRLVAQGWVEYGAEDFLTIPQDILVPGSGNGVTVRATPYFSLTPANAFLNAAPDECGNIVNRLGDDGEKPDFRRREVRYNLVAYTVSNVGTPNPVFVDTTPASVQFSVFVVDDTGVGNPPVKSFSRQ